MPREFRCFVFGRHGEGGLSWAADLEEVVRLLRHMGPGAYWVRSVVADLDAYRRRDYRSMHELRSGGEDDYGGAFVGERGMTLHLKA